MYKTEYDIALEELTEEGKVRNLTEEQSSEILNEIYSGYSKFITEQRNNEQKSEQGLREINLNA